MAYSYYYLKHISPDDIKNMKNKEAEKILRDMLKKVGSRERQFREAGDTVYSSALDTLTKNIFEDEVLRGHVTKQGEWSISKIDVKKEKINDKKKLIRQIRNFLNSKTATVKGARRVSRDQDLMIFGSNDSGRPLYRLTSEERTEFWSVYEEFQRTYPSAGVEYRYLMQRIGEEIISDRKKGVFGRFTQGGFVSASRLAELYEKMNRERLENAPDIEPNVFSGRWNDRK